MPTGVPPEKTSLTLHTHTTSLCVIERDAATDNTKISTGPCMCDLGKQILSVFLS